MASVHCITSSDTGLLALRTQQEYDLLTELHLVKGSTTCSHAVTGLVVPEYGRVGIGTSLGADESFGFRASGRNLQPMQLAFPDAGLAGISLSDSLHTSPSRSPKRAVLPR
jgi:hypothetical protein